MTSHQQSRRHLDAVLASCNELRHDVRAMSDGLFGNLCVEIFALGQRISLCTSVHVEYCIPAKSMGTNVHGKDKVSWIRFLLVPYCPLENRW